MYALSRDANHHVDSFPRTRLDATRSADHSGLWAAASEAVRKLPAVPPGFGEEAMGGCEKAQLRAQEWVVLRGREE